MSDRSSIHSVSGNNSDLSTSLSSNSSGYEVDLVENVNEVINREDFEGIQPWRFEPQGPDLGAEEEDEERMADDVPMEDNRMGNTDWYINLYTCLTLHLVMIDICFR